ncbi:PAS domain-containing sensor histidine kinase [Lutibacter citreus]|uniref:PAS domain-containing sensor histidine kinase n=1 Tax=Lutibacter citreus TaxID=2138210 RepID=UPI000DBE9DC7|nr:HAMP domain-containing sensor histidine kinase [Lutibacter citreus]
MVVKKSTSYDLENRILELESEISELKNNESKSQIIKADYTHLLDINKNDFYKNILEATPYIYVVKDINSVYIEANKSFCDFLGKKKEEIIGKTDYDFFPKKEAEEYIKGDKEVLAGRIHGKEEWEVLGGEGLKWLKVAKTVIYNEDDKDSPIGVLCSVTDISFQKRTETSLIKSKRKLKELNAMKNSFFSIIGHDLKTPLSNIIGFSKLSIENIENSNLEKVKEFLKIIHSSANKSFLLLSDLLEWSRSHSDKIQINEESINLNSVIANAMDITFKSTIDKKIKFNIICNEELTIKSDKYILSTVIRNLLSNALKFSYIGGEIKIVCLEVIENKVNKGVKIIVEDAGVGISKDSLSTLFKIDKTISTKGTNGEVGTGLGLILCKEFVEKIGGNIKVESELGKGSKFIVTLNK